MYVQFYLIHKQQQAYDLHFILREYLGYPLNAAIVTKNSYSFCAFKFLVILIYG